MPSNPDPKVQRGWQSALQRGCAGCHQSADSGVLSGQTDPVPSSTAFGSNLTPDPDTGMDSWDAGTIVASLRMGTDDKGLPLCPAMPKYADMGDDEAAAVAAYLQSLVAVHHAIPNSVCLPVKPVPDAGEDGASDAAPDAALDGVSTADAVTDGGPEGGDDGATEAGADAPGDAVVSDGGADAVSDASGGG
jgi:hypothetical protein